MKGKITTIILCALLLSGCGETAGNEDTVSHKSEETTVHATTSATVQTTTPTTTNSVTTRPRIQKPDSTIIKKPCDEILWGKYKGKSSTNFTIVNAIDKYYYLNSGESRSVTLNCAFEIKGSKPGGKIIFKVNPNKLNGTEFTDICIFCYNPQNDYLMPIDYKKLTFNKKNHTITFPAEQDMVYVVIDRLKYKNVMTAILEEYSQKNQGENN